MLPKHPRQTRGLPRAYSKQHIRHSIRQHNSVSLVRLQARSQLDKPVRPRRLRPEHSVLTVSNSALEQDVNKLERLTLRNASIRKDWLNIQQRVLDLETMKKLDGARPADENSGLFESRGLLQTLDGLLYKYKLVTKGSC